jgi:hypothetical protein
MTRPNTTTIWPFDISPWNLTLQSQFFEFENLGIQSWIVGNEDNDLLLIVDHYFVNDSDFDAQKELAYSKIPLWTDDNNRAESDEYCQSNNITIEITEVTNPNLSGYTRITADRAQSRTFDALNSLN